MTFPRVRLSQLVGVCSEDSRAEVGAWQDAHPHTDLSAALDAAASHVASASQAVPVSQAASSARDAEPQASAHRSSPPSRSLYLSPHSSHSARRSSSLRGSHSSWGSHSSSERTHLLPRLSWRAPSALALICLLTLALTCSLTLLLIQARNNTDFLISTAEVSAGETKTRRGTIGYGQDNSPGAGTDSSANSGSGNSSSAASSAQSDSQQSSSPSSSSPSSSSQAPSLAPSSQAPSLQPADSCATGICVDGKVNLNTANEQQLQTVKGIGPQLASKIITLRNQTGKLTSLDQLDSIPGVGPKMLEKWRDSLVVR